MPSIVLGIALCTLLAAPAGAALAYARESAASALARRADVDFALAEKAFGARDFERTSEEILKGADEVELASFAVRGTDRTVLRNETADLRSLAGFVEHGTVADRQALEIAFAAADRALALATHRAAVPAAAG
jgi:hypothetical protein